MVQKLIIIIPIHYRQKTNANLTKAYLSRKKKN